jgi:hypothetical protein
LDICEEDQKEGRSDEEYFLVIKGKKRPKKIIGSNLESEWFILRYCHNRIL